MNIFCCYVYYLIPSIWHYDSNSTHIWHFFPQDLENAKKSSNASEQTASADARSVPKCRQIRNVPNCQV